MCHLDNTTYEYEKGVKNHSAAIIWFGMYMHKLTGQKLKDCEKHHTIVLKVTDWLCGGVGGMLYM